MVLGASGQRRGQVHSGFLHFALIGGGVEDLDALDGEVEAHVLVRLPSLGLQVYFEAA